jgi:hypothetical protein
MTPDRDLLVGNVFFGFFEGHRSGSPDARALQSAASGTGRRTSGARKVQTRWPSSISAWL